MAIKKLPLIQHDLQPYYYAKAKQADGTVINLTGASILCTMKAPGATSNKIDRRTTGIVITNAATGEFELRWQAGDTNTVGSYYLEFEVTPQSGGKFTLGPGTVQINAGQDSV